MEVRGRGVGGGEQRDRVKCAAGGRESHERESGGVAGMGGQRRPKTRGEPGGGYKGREARGGSKRREARREGGPKDGRRDGGQKTGGGGGPKSPPQQWGGSRTTINKWLTPPCWEVDFDTPHHSIGASAQWDRAIQGCF